MAMAIFRQVQFPLFILTRKATVTLDIHTEDGREFLLKFLCGYERAEEWILCYFFSPKTL